MDAKLSAPQDEVEYQVELGNTFRNSFSHSYHTLQYAFRPDSVSNHGILARTLDGALEVEFPAVNLEQTSNPNWYFKGNYQQCKNVECLLILDKDRKNFKLEKLSGSAKGLKPGPKPTKNSALLDIDVTNPNSIQMAISSNTSANMHQHGLRKRNSEQNGEQTKRIKKVQTPVEQATDDDLENLVTTIENPSDPNLELQTLSEITKSSDIISGENKEEDLFSSSSSSDSSSSSSSSDSSESEKE